MEKRPYFVLGDALANVLVATTTIAVSTAAIGGDIGMIPGMLVGMLLGMVIALIMSLVILAPILGIMEILTPCMLGGMVGGMFGGMWDLSGAEILQWGVATGLGAQVFVYTMNAVLGGPQHLDANTPPRNGD